MVLFRDIIFYDTFYIFSFMANTNSQLYVQIVFAVKNRASLIQSEWETKLYQYITGILRNRGQKVIAINGMPDHIHILLGITPDCSLSDLVREVKKSSNTWITENKLTPGKFYWQSGFGAFSYSRSDLDSVATYVRNQKQHHQRKRLRDEYTELLKEFEVAYEESYIFDDVGAM